MKKQELPPRKLPKATISIVRRGMMNEREMHAQLTNYEKETFALVDASKKDNWLLGRMAGKRAVTAYCRTRTSVEVAHMNIEIASGQGNPPTCAIFDSRIAPEIGENCLLSLSHSDGVAVAQAVDRRLHKGVGVDVERIRDFSHETLRGFLTDQEYRNYCSVAAASARQEATLYWCLKEAYLKAIGQGLRIHPRTVDTPHPKERLGNTTFCVSGNPVPVSVSWTETDDHYMIVSITL